METLRVDVTPTFFQASAPAPDPQEFLTIIMSGAISSMAPTIGPIVGAWSLDFLTRSVVSHSRQARESLDSIDYGDSFVCHYPADLPNIWTHRSVVVDDDPYDGSEALFPDITLRLPAEVEAAFVRVAEEVPGRTPVPSSSLTIMRDLAHMLRTGQNDPWISADDSGWVMMEIRLNEIDKLTVDLAPSGALEAVVSSSDTGITELDATDILSLKIALIRWFTKRS